VSEEKLSDPRSLAAHWHRRAETFGSVEVTGLRGSDNFSSEQVVLRRALSSEEGDQDGSDQQRR
jgi:hypothetical protein